MNANDKDSTKTIKSEWTINLSYPSYFGIFLSDVFSKDYVYYPLGISFSIDWKKEFSRTWLSPGFIYRTKTINHPNEISEWISLMEIPIKIKYCLNKNESKIDPFISSALSLCRIESKFSGNIDHPEDLSLSNRHYLDYLPIVHVGIGSNFQLIRNIDFVIESDFGYSINHVLPNRASIELLAGFRFKI